MPHPEQGPTPRDLMDAVAARNGVNNGKRCTTEHLVGLITDKEPFEGAMERARFRKELRQLLIRDDGLRSHLHQSPRGVYVLDQLKVETGFVTPGSAGGPDGPPAAENTRGVSSSFLGFFRL